MESTQRSLNDFFAPWKVSFEKSTALWARQFETAERIGTANVSAFKAVCDASSLRRKHEGSEQDYPLAFGNSVVQMMTDSLTNYLPMMYQLANEANDELSTIAIKYVNKWSDIQVSAFDKMADRAPAGVDAVLKALSQATSIAAANQVFLLEAFISRTNATEQEAMEARKKAVPAPVESE